MYDALVIGGGLLGCFASRELRRYEIKTALVEAREDVCTGLSRANTAIIYPGYDNAPGSLKAALTLRANAGFDALCAELDVPFSRPGLLMLSYGGRADAVLRKKLGRGLENGVPGLSLVSGAEAMELEPGLREGVSSALYAPTTGTVEPWELGIAAFENARQNGCEAMLNSRVLSIGRADGGYVIETENKTIRARAVINCGGLQADRIQETLFPPTVRIFPDAADYLIVDRAAEGKPRRILLHEPEDGGKGLTAVPTVDGALLLGPSERPALGGDLSTDAAGLDFVRDAAARILPGLDMGAVIRSFAALRPKPRRVVLKDGDYVPDGESIGDFVIERPAPGFTSLIGIKTPGLTCARELGRLLASETAQFLCAAENPDFEPERRGIRRARGLGFSERAALIAENPDYAEMICFCEDVSRAEIVEAIRRGAVTLDGVKRRTGAMMGACQGGRCQQGIAALLQSELGLAPEEITKDGGASFILGGRHGTL